MTTPLPADAEAEPGAAVPGGASVTDGGRGAFLVGAGIFLSRIVGLVRTRVLAHYLGLGDAADAFNAAMRIPNFLQNMFGEGVLSASFIPVYASLIARGEEREAGRVAGTVAAILTTVVSAVVLAGELASPWLVGFLAGGFEGPKRELTERLVRVLFPGVGLLVLSAWCLGVLNSHRRFFLSYAAPVLWNAAIILALTMFAAGRAEPRLAELAAWGAVVGSALQLLVQLPTVLRLVPQLRAARRDEGGQVRTVVRNFVPVFVGRGVVQVSAFVDTLIAGYLVAGSVAALSNAQLLYMLPVSLFGMAVSAAELPAMSSATGDAGAVAAHLRARLATGVRRILFFVVPSAVAFVAVGDSLAGALFQSGRFTRGDAVWVWGILAAASVGLLPSTLGRLFASALYALRDARAPLRFAVVRVALGAALGAVLAFGAPRWLGVDPRWAVAGLAAASGLAGWAELALLRRAVGRRVGVIPLPPAFAARIAGAAGAAAAAGLLLKRALTDVPPLPAGAAVAAVYGLTFLAASAALRVPEAARLAQRLRRR
ncbi:MAG TPA: murein biosynthesis integral membrane protein MurJ [Gemmatimonadaceae bacterium]|nr:murein biosynthesis integral membrane protein MurJ [Gemmatimonadaceae bacterium]